MNELTSLRPKRRVQLMKKKQKRAGRVTAVHQASVPDSEAWLYRNPEALAAVRRGLQDAAAGRTVSLGSFARFAADKRQR
jgi:predicted transcriptional regulator